MREIGVGPNKIHGLSRARAAPPRPADDWLRFCSGGSASGRLQLDETREGALCGHQLVVGADFDDAAVLHILDSLVLLPYIDKAPEGALLDMGTGAGFPGIPLTIASGRKATYIDSVGKKVDAVNSFVSALRLKHAYAVHDRLEEYARSHKKQFAVVTARALAPLPVLVEYASPFLKDGGLFVITKGNPSDEELQSGIAAAKICGFTTLMTDDLDLPNGLGHREFIILKKSRHASVSLPRANGMAKKNPLA